MAAKRFDDTLGKRIVKEYRNGSSGPDISKRFKVTVSTVYYYLRLLNVKRRPRSVGKTGKPAKVAKRAKAKATKPKTAPAAKAA